LSGIYNSELDLKIRLRKKFMIDPGSNSVLDVFAGPGEMYKALYFECRNYLGIELDEKIPNAGRKLIYGKAIDVLPKLDLSSFDVFDLDAFSNPWKEFFYILGNGPDAFTVFLTESSGRMVNQDLKDYVSQKNNFTKKLDRLGSIKYAVSASVKAHGRSIADSYIYMKKKQPRTIYAALRVGKGPSSGLYRT
jgi:hypothetical protein